MMEVTMNLGDVGDVTAAVPNLADLLAGAEEAEEATEAMDLTTGDLTVVESEMLQVRHNPSV
jgi:hypothetical protein